MANCDINRGLNLLECKDAVGGIRRLYLTPFAEYDIETLSDATSGHTATGLGTLDEVFQYEVKNSGNSFEEVGESSRDNGTTVYNTTVTAILTKLTKQKAFQLKLMNWGRVLAFIELNQGDILLVGLENGCEISSTSSVGGEMNGTNSSTISIVGMERAPSYFLTDSAIAALKLLVSTSNI